MKKECVAVSIENCPSTDVKSHQMKRNIVWYAIEFGITNTPKTYKMLLVT